MMGLVMMVLGWGAALAMQSAETPTSAPAGQPTAPEVTTLGSVEPLRTYFNDHRERLRFMALLSPT